MSEDRYQDLADNFEIEILEKGLGLTPLNMRIVEQLAFAYTRVGRYEDGLRMDQRLVQAYPKSELVHYNMACSLSLTGRLEEAIDALLVAIDLGYGDFQHLMEDDDLRAATSHARFIEVRRAISDPSAEVDDATENEGEG